MLWVFQFNLTLQRVMITKQRQVQILGGGAHLNPNWATREQRRRRRDGGEEEEPWGSYVYLHAVPVPRFCGL